ncbi:MAG: hypothetical protein IJ901_07055, partial [Bacteroidaceae bacterium]|nr:hypothetical protein [Bacteroidaceae bacterium]
MKKLFVLLTMAFLPILASAQAGVNELRISDIKSVAGEQVVMPVELINEGTVFAFGGYLILPEGVSIAEIKVLPDRWDSEHTMVSFRDQTPFPYPEYRKYVFVAINGNVPVSGNKGEVLHLILNVDEGMADGVYEIRLEEGQLSVRNDKEVDNHLEFNTKSVAIQTIGKASLEIKGRGDATGISNVPSAVREDAGIYDLTGRRLKTAPQRGVYIQGKKKIAK